MHDKAEQLVVLAHDLYFIRDLRNDLEGKEKRNPTAVFQLAHANQSYSDFSEILIDRECESSYFRHHRMLFDAVVNGAGDMRAVAKAIRPMLEGYLHRRFPGLLPKDLMFGQVVCQIRDAEADSPLKYAQDLIAELNDINAYAGQFHHDTNPDHAETLGVVVTELLDYAKRALNVVHKGAP
jgi:wobble nucleotide-excising tRNase